MELQWIALLPELGTEIQGTELDLYSVHSRDLDIIVPDSQHYTASIPTTSNVPSKDIENYRGLCIIHLLTHPV